MPYIINTVREDLRQAVDTLVELLDTFDEPGDLNFVISTLIWSKWTANPKYHTGNELIGVLECAKLEFYRRRLAPYENKALKRNGDLEI